MVLQRADVPAQWITTAYQADPSDDASKAALAKCTGTRSTTGGEVADVHSSNFTAGTATISSQATSYRSTADVAADRAMITSPKASKCYRQLVRDEIGPSLPGDAKIDTFDVRITPRTGDDPANVVGHGSAKIVVTYSGQQVSVYSDAVFIAGPLVEAELDFQGVLSPVPETLQSQLTRVVADRVAHS